MNLLHHAIKSTRLIQTVHPNQTLRSLFSASISHRPFSTESAPPSSQSSTKPFFETPSAGLVYGKLVGITKNTLKSDVLSLLDESNLSIDDVKVDYNPSFLPMGMMVQFSSRSAYDAALRAINRKGRLYRLERADRSNWDSIQPYGGKSVLLQGIPPNATLEDVEWFLAGSEYDSSNIRLFTRQGAFGPTKVAIIRFVSSTAAMSAMIMKNRGFFYNNQISMHVLQ
ncbi:uncharacterized protein LOC143618913 [Bidens hawaiensis]|uniref:uncharacterized protein LOC143618913 n=1 Tax=Bidens hawaiensis TaxID=980011 RepID=UPI00404B594B